MVAELIETDHAYVTPGGDVYFRVRSDDDYGKLSRRKLEEAVSGTRVLSSEEKEDEGDSPCGRRPSRASQAGTAPGARAGRAGTSSARR